MKSRIILAWILHLVWTTGPIENKKPKGTNDS